MRRAPLWARHSNECAACASMYQLIGAIFVLVLFRCHLPRWLSCTARKPRARSRATTSGAWEWGLGRGGRDRRCSCFKSNREKGSGARKKDLKSRLNRFKVITCCCSLELLLPEGNEQGEPAAQLLRIRARERHEERGAALSTPLWRLTRFGIWLSCCAWR